MSLFALFECDAADCDDAVSYNEPDRLDFAAMPGDKVHILGCNLELPSDWTVRDHRLYCGKHSGARP